MQKLLLALGGAAALMISTGAAAQYRSAPERDPVLPGILPLEDRAKLEDRWLKERIETLVPMLMRRDGVDMWILIAGEYNEDPVAETMLPATWLTARRRTILVFFDRGPERGIEQLALARYPVGDFVASWDPDKQKDQWARLAEIVAERDPKKIALNSAEEFPLADGLTASHLKALMRSFDPKYTARFTSHDRLGLGWLETRIPAEMATYPTISRIAHAIINEGFSERVITPGVTTSDDVVWWFRNRIAELKLDTWFQPSVAIQRNDGGSFTVQQMGHRGDTVIQPGDMLHVDFGIDYLGLKTDIQRLAYVLKPGEVQPPKGLRDGLAAMNKVKDAVVAELKTGRGGNEVLAAARKRIEAQRIEGSIYSHPIGYHGHGAGPWIGSWEDQSGTAFRGDYKVHPNTAWSIELNAQANVPEWGGQKVRFMFEENGFYDGRSFRFLDGSQDEFILIPRP